MQAHRSAYILEHSACILEHSACILKHSVCILEHSARILEHSARILEQSGTFCTYSGWIWNILHAFCNILDHSACILEHSAFILEHSAIILEHSVIILDHSGTFCCCIECCKKVEFQLADGQTDKTLGLVELLKNYILLWGRSGGCKKFDTFLRLPYSHVECYALCVSAIVREMLSAVSVNHHCLTWILAWVETGKLKSRWTPCGPGSN